MRRKVNRRQFMRAGSASAVAVVLQGEAERLAGPLRERGYRLSSELTAQTLLVTTSLDAAASAHLATGGHVLLLAEAGDQVPEKGDLSIWGHVCLAMIIGGVLCALGGKLMRRLLRGANAHVATPLVRWGCWMAGAGALLLALAALGLAGLPPK